MLTALLLAATALASPTAGDAPAPEEPPPRSAVLIDPLGPTIALAARALDIPALDANLRGHHMVSDRIGVTVELDFTQLTMSYAVRGWYLGARAGPRLALRGRGLEDWTLTPFVLGGPTVVTVPGSGPMARWGVLGGGAEAGRTWVWGPVAFELGLGLLVTRNIGYRAMAPAAVGRGPEPGPFVVPMLDLGVGHAW
jgi:hypothetical protein